MFCALLLLYLLCLYVVAHFIRATHLFRILDFTSITQHINDAGAAVAAKNGNDNEKLKRNGTKKHRRKKKPTGNDDEKFLAFSHNKT